MTRRLMLATQLIAAAIGVGVAVATAGHATAGQPAYAATHCTRYAPDTTPDVNCEIDGTIDAAYITHYVAWRTANYIDLNAVRSWELFYVFQGGGSALYKAGYSTGASTGAYTAAQMYAECNTDYVSGHCVTYWHD